MTPGLTSEHILHCQIAIYIWFEIQLLQRSGKTTDHTLHSEAQLYQAQKPDTSCNWREKVVCKIFSGKAGIVRSEKSIVTRFFFGGWEFSSSSPFGRKAWAECLLRSFSLCHTKACQSQGEKVNMLWLAQPELRKWKVISIDINSRKTGLNTSIATAARAPKL